MAQENGASADEKSEILQLSLALYKLLSACVIDPSNFSANHQLIEEFEHMYNNWLAPSGQYGGLKWNESSQSMILETCFELFIEQLGPEISYAQLYLSLAIADILLQTEVLICASKVAGDHDSMISMSKHKYHAIPKDSTHNLYHRTIVGIIDFISDSAVKSERLFAESVPSSASHVPAVSRVQNSFSSTLHNQTLSPRQQNFLIQQDRKQSISWALSPSISSASPTSAGYPDSNEAENNATLGRWRVSEHQRAAVSSVDVGSSDYPVLRITQKTCRSILSILQFVILFPDKFEGSLKDISNGMKMLDDSLKQVSVLYNYEDSFEIALPENWHIPDNSMKFPKECINFSDSEEHDVDNMLRLSASHILEKLYKRCIKNVYNDVYMGSRVLMQMKKSFIS